MAAESARVNARVNSFRRARLGDDRAVCLDQPPAKKLVRGGIFLANKTLSGLLDAELSQPWPNRWTPPRRTTPQASSSRCPPVRCRPRRRLLPGGLALPSRRSQWTGNGLRGVNGLRNRAGIGDAGQPHPQVAAAQPPGQPLPQVSLSQHQLYL